VGRPSGPFDIKPTSCRNPFNMRATGVLPVAILGTATFDVTLIDPVTVIARGGEPTPVVARRRGDALRALPGQGRPYDCTTLGPDGYLDMTFKFNHQQVAAALGPVAPGDVIVVPLDGYLFDGTYIFGEDVIVILEVTSQRQNRDLDYGAAGRPPAPCFRCGAAVHRSVLTRSRLGIVKLGGRLELLPGRSPATA